MTNWSNVTNKKRAGKGVIYADLSYQVMGAVFEVHNQLGPGFTENIYERALMIELEKRNITYEAQKEIEVVYKGQKLGKYRLDILIEGKIILELKAVTSLSDLFKQQLLSYLRATQLKLGILINFGEEQVQYTRVTN